MTRIFHSYVYISSFLERILTQKKKDTYFSFIRKMTIKIFLEQF